MELSGNELNILFSKMQQHRGLHTIEELVQKTNISLGKVSLALDYVQERSPESIKHGDELYEWSYYVSVDDTVSKILKQALAGISNTDRVIDLLIKSSVPLSTKEIADSLSLKNSAIYNCISDIRRLPVGEFFRTMKEGRATYYYFVEVEDAAKSLTNPLSVREDLNKMCDEVFEIIAVNEQKVKDGNLTIENITDMYNINKAFYEKISPSKVVKILGRIGFSEIPYEEDVVSDVVIEEPVTTEEIPNIPVFPPTSEMPKSLNSEGFEGLISQIMTSIKECTIKFDDYLQASAFCKILMDRKPIDIRLCRVPDGTATVSVSA
jgi:predicted transcriptional regulator